MIGVGEPRAVNLKNNNFKDVQSIWGDLETLSLQCTSLICTDCTLCLFPAQAKVLPWQPPWRLRGNRVLLVLRYCMILHYLLSYVVISTSMHNILMGQFVGCLSIRVLIFLSFFGEFGPSNDGWILCPALMNGLNAPSLLICCWEEYRCLLLFLFDAKDSSSKSFGRGSWKHGVNCACKLFATSSTTNIGKLKHKPAIDARGCSCAKCAHCSSASSTAAEARGAEQFYCSARNWPML